MATAGLGSPFPGRTLRVGALDAASVLAVQQRLNSLGCGPIEVDGVFGQQTLDAVELFQARSMDAFGAPLPVDGLVGPMTWAALFGNVISEVTHSTSPLLLETLVVAARELGVREEPVGSNRGPRVDQYVRSAGLDPAGHYPWCACFVYWCFDQAAAALGLKNPVVRTAGVLEHWNEAADLGDVRRLANAECIAEPQLVQPGMIFVILLSSGNGHTGLVEGVRGMLLTTLEGNTNDGGSREGIGVLRRTTRRISQMRGFIDYSSAGTK
jgi:hypothetical protein